MNAERLLVWAVALAATATVLAAYVAPATPPAQLVIAALAVVVVFPLAVVLVGYLYSFRTVKRG